MPESLWQAVQEETEKQTVKTPAKNVSKPVQRPQTHKVRPRPRPVQPKEKNVQKKDRTSPRPDVRTPDPKSERPKERRTERRPYDFYQDQVLCLKEIKLEIEKRYGRRVTANAMVQLAVDLLIEDYRRNKERSKLISKLVADERTFGRTSVGSTDL